MTLSKNMMYVATGLIFVAIAAAVGAGIWYLVVASPSLSVKDTEAQLKRMQVSAQLYRYRITTYDGVCKDVGAIGKYVCNETDEAYAIEGRLDNGNYYCVDSKDFAGERYRSVGTDTVCPEE